MLVFACLFVAACSNEDSSQSAAAPAAQAAPVEQQVSAPASENSASAQESQPELSEEVSEAQAEPSTPEPAAVEEPATVASSAVNSSSAAATMSFIEGVHYTVVGSELSSQPEVVEFFSFNCIHCYTFAPVFNQLKSELAGEITARSVHVDFLGNNGRDLTWAYAMMVVMGVDDKVKMPLFAAIHDSRARITRNSIADLFVLHGVSREDFDSHANSFAVSGMEARMRQATMQQRVRGTPTVIINGIYEVQRGAVRTPAEMAALARYLRDKDFS